MEELIKSIKAFLYDRIASPLFGAFAAAWAIWNYKFILIVLSSDLSYSEKITEIDKAFSILKIPFFAPTEASAWHSGMNSLVMPMLLALTYIYLYPLIAKPIFEHSLKKEKEIRDIKQAADKARVLSEEESTEIFLMISQTEEKATKDAEAARKKQSSLTEEIERLRAELEEHSKPKPQEIKPPSIPLDEDTPSRFDPEGMESTRESFNNIKESPADELLSLLEKSYQEGSHISATTESLRQAIEILIFLSNQDFASADAIHESTGMNKTKVKSLLEFLTKEQLTFKGSRPNYGEVYQLQKKGQQYLLKAGHI